MKNNKSHFSTFNPQKLTDAREARGLTLKELSELVGVSHQAISKFEKGATTPSSQTLERISDTLTMPIHYFFSNSKEATEDSVVFFRSRAAATVKSKKIHSKRINWVKIIHKYLDDILEFPKLDIPKYNVSDVYEPIAFEEIDEIANTVRKKWGLGDGPISNILLLLEKKGAIISRATFADYKIDACSRWENDERPYIFLGNDKTAPRSRFDVAHELGHLILHPNLKLSEFNNKVNYKLIEKEADRFASAFLLPASSFGNEVMSSSLDHFVSLKKRWKISIQAMAYRAYQLNILNEYQFIYLRKKLASNNQLKNEPLDDVIPFEEPSALKQSIELILQHGIKTKEELVYEIGLSRDDIEILANLEPGYLLDTAKHLNVISFKLKKDKL
ncbi:transcriptional regulator [Brevibacillus laterosporus]|uniref:helix-turn-helix domain-containing protein n=1 Tax=Brevibacillus laterosporus TaxID=1465 RepID=UPI000C76C6BA|nr:XRE family transcriptional regulator [Brevibacillus laterosporus]AUM65772.1 transcriptional regulator [Brevibacillus laterosporus]